MSFLNPFFLFGLLAAAIPVIIHLFTRRRPREVRFPSLEFLSEVNQSEIRRLRLKQWLLLLLRALAIAAIAMAMARPALRGALGANADAATTVVVLVDRSESMGAVAPSTTRGADLMGDARRLIEDLLATLGPQDEVLLVPYDHAPHPVTPRPSADLGRVRAAAQALTASADVTDHRAALAAASAALASSNTLNRELFWISDFQSSGFGATGLENLVSAEGPWDRVRTYLIPLSPALRANVALTEAAPAPSEGAPALSVSSASFDAPAGDLAVDVRDVDGDAELGRGFLNAPARGDASALLPLARLPERGGVVRIPDDALALDNTRWFASGRSGTIKVLLREEGGPSPLRLALEAGGATSGLDVEVVDGAALPARVGDADAIVLNDLERMGSIELQAVLDFHRAGGGLFVILGDRADSTFWNGALLRELGAGTLGPPERAAPGAAWRLIRAVAGHPALAGFPARPGEPLSTARFQTIRAFTAAPGARTLLEFGPNRPALIETPQAMVFAASLSSDDSDFPISGAFLPLMHQIVRVLGSGTAAASLVPGDRYSAPAATGAWRIEDAAGNEIASELVAERSATRLRSAPLVTPGLYSVRRGGALVRTFAVNPDPAESDLAAADTRAIVAAFPSGRAQVLRPDTSLGRRLREARYGRELWSWFVILALVLLALESIIGRWGMASRAPKPAEG